MDSFGVCGNWEVECFDPDGTRAWRERFPNLVTTVGLNYLLDSGLGATLYAGLIDNASYTGVAAADTMSSHAGWTELQDYSESVRQTWSKGAASGGVMTNGTQMSFTINANGKTAKGLFITTVSTKGGTTGTLLSAGAFSAAQAVYNGQVLKATYTITAVSG